MKYLHYYRKKLPFEAQAGEREYIADILLKIGGNRIFKLVKRSQILP